MSKPRKKAAGSSESRTFVEAAVLLALVVMVGTTGFVTIEDWSIGRALYFTVITITTVGYGDEGISQAGRVFATLLLVCGLGVASHSFAQLVNVMSKSEHRLRKRMQARIDKLRDHVIVCGFGRMGQAVCRRLQAEGKPLVVVEQTKASFDAATREGLLAIMGIATEDETLIAAGVKHAGYVVSAVDTRHQGILVTLTARGLAPGVRIVARAESTEDEEKLRRAGADVVITPLRTGGLQAANIIICPELSRFLDDVASADKEVVMVSIVVGAGSELVGRELRDYGQNVTPHVSFVSLRRNATPVMTPPAGTVTLRAGDQLIVAGVPTEILHMKGDAQAPPT